MLPKVKPLLTLIQFALLLCPLADSTLMDGLIQLNCSYVLTSGERRNKKV